MIKQSLNQCTCGHLGRDHDLTKKGKSCKNCPCDEFEKAAPGPAPNAYDPYYGLTPLMRKAILEEFNQDDKTPVAPRRRVRLPPKNKCTNCIGFRSDMCMKCKGFGEVCSSCKEPETTCFCGIEFDEIPQ